MSQPSMEEPESSWATTTDIRHDNAGREGRDPRAVRDALALLLMVLGAVGLTVVLFVAHPLAGAAALCVVTLAAGALLGLDR